MDNLDHRSLGTRLDLWHIQEDAPGMVFWHPRGHTLYRVLEDYIRRKMRRLGYAEVRTPQLLPRELWIQSGHWERFGAHMFNVADGERPMALKQWTVIDAQQRSTTVTLMELQSDVRLDPKLFQFTAVGGAGVPPGRPN